MPTILLKKSDTPGSVPGTANLTNLAGGVEVAVNTADKRVYSMTSASAVIELGTNPSSLTCADVSATVLRAGSATITNLLATTLTVSGGTANGVLYLNGSKVATSGTALTFDGTNGLGFGTGGTGNTAAVLTLKGSSATNFGAAITGTRNGSGSWFIGDAGTAIGSGTLGFIYYNYTTNDPWIWYDGGASAERMRLTSTGLGIGTSSPSTIGVSGYTRLVLGAGSASTDGLTIVPSGTGGVQFTDAANVKKGYLQWDASTGALALGTAGTTKATLDSSGNLGIGTSSPANYANYRNLAISGTTGGNIDMLSGSTKVGNLFNDGTNFYAYNAIAGSLVFGTNNTEVARFDSSGNLGIGTSSPSTYTIAPNLVVASSGFSGMTIRSASNNYGGVFFADGTTGDEQYRGFIQYNHTYAGVSDYMFFGTAGATRMTLTDSGNLGIGTTNPSNKFVVSDAGAAGLEIAPTGTASNPTVLSFNRSTSAYGQLTFASDLLVFMTGGTNERARISAAGDLLVGTTATTSGARLDVKGVDSTSSNYCVFFENSSSALLLAVQNDGRWRSGTAAASPYNFVVGATNRDLFVDNAGEIGYVSSVRESKTNITPVSDVSWLLQLNPVTFNFRKKDAEGKYTDDPDGPIKHGLIAEEVEAVNADLCFYDDVEVGGKLRGVNYSHLITPMLKLLQEQQAMIKSLEAKVAALESK